MRRRFVYTALLCVGIIDVVCATATTTDAKETLVRAPVFLSHAGPQDFTLNTTALDAPLLDLDESLSDFCEPIEAAGQLEQLRGKTVMVDIIGGICSWETSYIHLSSAGVQAILVRSSKFVPFAPGRFHRTIGSDFEDVVAASFRTVPMVQLSHEETDLIDTIMENANGVPIYIILEAEENDWTAMFTGTTWKIMMRIIIPLVYFGVVLMSATLLAHGGFQRGGTQ